MQDDKTINKNDNPLSSDDQAKLNEDMTYAENDPAAGTFGESIGDVGDFNDNPAINSDDLSDEKLKDY